MKAYNSGSRKSKQIRKFLKGSVRLSFEINRLLIGTMGSTIKKKDNIFSIRGSWLGGRPTIYQLHNWLDPKQSGRYKMNLKKPFKKCSISISSAVQYFNSKGEFKDRKYLSKWLKSSVNKYQVYNWVNKD